MIGMLAFLAIVAIAAVWIAGIYNGLVTARNAYKNAFAQIDVQLQRRFDLVPNLVEVAKMYMSHESEAACRADGVLRVEGKEYVVNDGDVMHFLFNV